ncbi:MAG: hypothetical protein WCA85_13170 [Paraburkholderia sp.]|uniref:hypothetical protein n=1 Tax=Paraburkholderia sp. TaxID=1926495 RepID=UPI003C69D226
MKNKATIQLPSVSPYSIKNLDSAIGHLERVINDERALLIFGPIYWRMRIQQAHATPGIMHTQLRRLRKLLDLLDAATPRATADPRHSPERCGSIVLWPREICTRR